MVPVRLENTQTTFAFKKLNVRKINKDASGSSIDPLNLIRFKNHIILNIQMQYEVRYGKQTSVM